MFTSGFDRPVSLKIRTAFQQIKENQNTSLLQKKEIKIVTVMHLANVKQKW